MAAQAGSLKTKAVAEALQAEADLGYMVASGRYWEVADQLDKDKLAAIDSLWLTAWAPKQL